MDPSARSAFSTVNKSSVLNIYTITVDLFKSHRPARRSNRDNFPDVWNSVSLNFLFGPIFPGRATFSMQSCGTYLVEGLATSAIMQIIKPRKAFLQINAFICEAVQNLNTAKAEEFGPLIVLCFQSGFCLINKLLSFQRALLCLCVFLFPRY